MHGEAEWHWFAGISKPWGVTGGILMNTQEGDGRARRVAIIGTGAVGSTAAYAMIQAGVAREILLTDKDRRRAEGEVLDLQHCLPFTHAADLRVRDMEDVCDCDLLVITAGAHQEPGESRLDLIQCNVGIFESFVPELARNNPSAVFMIVTNPVDIMTRVVLRLSGFPVSRVVGTGTMLDTARFRTLLSHRCGVLPRHVHAHVIGEHGDSEVLVWSRAGVGPFRVAEYCDENRIPFGPYDVEAINRGVREAAYEIIERKEATHFAIGLAVVRLTQALFSDLNAIYTVSRLCEGAFGLSDVCLSVPTLIDRTGAHTPVELGISLSEQEALLRSAQVLAETYDTLSLGD
jgi:L-lactate dehydrogenase